MVLLPAFVWLFFLWRNISMERPPPHPVHPPYRFRFHPLTKKNYLVSLAVLSLGTVFISSATSLLLLILILLLGGTLGKPFTGDKRL